MHPDNLKSAEGLIVGAVSGLVTGVAAGGDVFGLRNISARPLCVTAIRLRWVSTTAFGAAQCLAFRMNKVYGFSAIHTTGGTAVQAHYRYQTGIAGSAVGDRVALTEISSYIAATGAITGSTYTAEDTDEPEDLMVGAGNVLPSVTQKWVPEDGLPLVLGPDTGLVINNHIAMGASGVGNLFIGIDGFRQG
jgi:hypothetical protein